MKKTALSIDTDFFVRELPEWDFGHSEDSQIYMTDTVWAMRYQMIQLYKETNPRTYADCLPQNLFKLLFQHGLDSAENIKVGAGWSHKFAYNVFKDVSFDMLVNLDAHHDCWSWQGKKLNCGNWVPKLKQKKFFKYVWVPPKWQDPNILGAYPKEIDAMNKLPNLLSGTLDDCELVAIYIAQSPAWIPPHHDQIFLKLIQIARAISMKSTLDFDGGYAKRNYVTKTDAASMYKKHKEQNCGML